VDSVGAPSGLRNTLLTVCVVVGLATATGCSLRGAPRGLLESSDHYGRLAQQLDYCVPGDGASPGGDLSATPPPRTLDGGELPEFRDLTLDEAIQIALVSTPVLRELGGTILRTPEAQATAYSPGLVETEPRFGVQAALSAFDAQFSLLNNFENNDRAFNNVFFGGGARLFKQDLDIFQAAITKRSAVGSQFAVRNNTEYDANNAPGNLFSSAWQTNFEAEVRQPLLQGAGLDYNRIAGPAGVPGLYHGVVLARINTDVEITDYQIALRDFVSNIENAYWDLYFAYRDLQAKIEARNGALDVLQNIRAQLGRTGFDTEREAEAEEQYWRFQQEVDNALNGRLLDGTRTHNGSSGGTFRGLPGVYVAERRLRLLIGLPSSDGRILRPVDEPITAEVVFDWHQSLCNALTRREELRRQRHLVQRCEMELTATENLLLPTLDVVGLYRFRGFGKDLLELTHNASGFGNAFDDLTTGDFQEWQLGLELSLPVGFRHAHNALRHYELLLARQRAVLREQENQIVHDISNAHADVDRAYRALETSFNRRRASRLQVEALQAKFDSGKTTVDEVLDAQRRLADADSAHFAARVEYTLAIRNVYLETGALLDYNGIWLVDGVQPRFMAGGGRLETGKPAPPASAPSTEPQTLRDYR
jgi:hypothetical protein